MEIVSEIPLKLTRKCVDVFGMDAINNEIDRRTVGMSHAFKFSQIHTVGKSGHDSLISSMSDL